MPDKSIPYFNPVMKRKVGTQLPKAELTEGYSFEPFRSGDERKWAGIESFVGEFDSVSDALGYFKKEYLTCVSEVERRTFFVVRKIDGMKIASFMSWWKYTDGLRVLSIEWIAIMPRFQGLGLEKAVVFEGMRRTIGLEGDVDIFVHTQTWSYKAVGIYARTGFEFMKTGSFGGYENEYERAVPFLKEKMGNRF